ncbi:HNH endonuclease signature motif containing protein [Sphaerisporangium perillae]|uniref:HNH endonuclease signature motif containing protein n=1 Tax=Sphaerisporangium perillae TaxID=2935860 RepID=UPI00200E4D56|nr:HNH endonuclease signature motif containing protein [Sphaerisporangium perillae]
MAEVSKHGQARPPGSGSLGPEWWAALVARSSGWSSDGSAAHGFDPLNDLHDQDLRHQGPHDRDAYNQDSRGTGARDPNVGGVDTEFGSARTSEQTDTPAGGRASWALVNSVREAAEALAVGRVPESATICMAEAEDLVIARDRLTSAIADRVGRVHTTGEARRQGHASTKTWLRAECGMSMAGAGHLVGLAVELARLPVVRARFASGVLPEGMVSAICTATRSLSDEQVRPAEAILVRLADEATPAEVAKAGRYLREALTPGGLTGDADADHAARFLIVRQSASGGMEGEFHLPREAAARLKTLLDAYAKPRTEGDDRPLRVRNADAFIALLEQKISTELLVLVNAGSLPDAPPAQFPEDGDVPAGDSGSRPTQTSQGTPAGPVGAVGAAGSVGPVGSTTSARPTSSVDDVCRTCGYRVDRALPALLPATGQLLPLGDIHRLARTSALIRIVMDAEGQVLNMGRRVRLATPAQRRAVFARYATCWVDDCPLPATMCQIDHADSWAEGGPTDLANLGPACQFHNRDRYRHPERYQRRRAGKDRWAYTYLGRASGPRHRKHASEPHHRT